jgi:HEAT repeat protein
MGSQPLRRLAGWVRAHKPLAIAVTILAGLTFGFWLRSFSQRPPGPPTIPQLIQALHRRDTRLDDARRALWVLLPNVVQNAMPGFAPRPPAAVVRAQAATALGDFGPAAARAVPSLAEALADSDVFVRQSAIESLSKLGPAATRAVPELITVLQDPINGGLVGIAGPRAQAASALVSIAPEEPLVRQTLLPLAEHEPDAGLRAHFIAELPKLRPLSRDVVAMLTNELASDVFEVRQAAVRALGDLGPFARETVPRLITHFEQGLEAQGEWHASLSPALLQRYGLSGLPNPPINSGLPVPGNAALPLPPPAAAPLPPTGPGIAPTTPARIVTRWGSGAVPPPPVTMTFTRVGGLSPQTYYQTSGVLESIGKIGPSAEAALPLLVRLSTNTSSPYQIQAAFVRWQVEQKPDQVIPLLRRALQEDSLPGRTLAIGYATRIGTAALPLLREVMQDPITQMRWTAVEALAQIAPEAAEEAAPELDQLLQHDPKYCVRVSAAKALHRIRPSQAAEWKAKLGRAIPSTFARP